MNMKKTLIIDYSLGNLRSVFNAMETVGGNPEIVNKPDAINDASHLILPGVGAFGDGISKLKELGWDEAIQNYIQSGKPFLGICLGMQLLGTKGFEHGMNTGLNIIPGKVERLPILEQKLRIPHVGWNDVEFCNDGKLAKSMNQKEDFYFVHSYFFMPDNELHIKGKCEYGNKFAAIIENDNVFATQFHPEKSQKAGLKLLNNFLEVF